MRKTLYIKGNDISCIQCLLYVPQAGVEPARRSLDMGF